MRDHFRLEKTTHELFKKASFPNRNFTNYVINTIFPKYLILKFWLKLNKTQFNKFIFFWKIRRYFRHLYIKKPHADILKTVGDSFPINNCFFKKKNWQQCKQAIVSIFKISSIAPPTDAFDGDVSYFRVN